MKITLLVFPHILENVFALVRHILFAEEIRRRGYLFLPPPTQYFSSHVFAGTCAMKTGIFYQQRGGGKLDSD